jgi:hypothetical protein
MLRRIHLGSSVRWLLMWLSANEVNRAYVYFTRIAPLVKLLVVTLLRFSWGRGYGAYI